MTQRFLAAIVLLLAASTPWAALELLPGSSPQVRSIGQQFAPVRVRVTDEAGQPVAGARVYFSLPQRWPEASVLMPVLPWNGLPGWHCSRDLATSCEGPTDASGEATFPPFVSQQLGTHTVTFRAAIFSGPSMTSMTSLGSATATFFVEPAANQPRLLAHGGDHQVVAQRARFEPFVVRYVDAGGRPIAGAEVIFDSRTGPLLFVPGLESGSPKATTDADGYARSPVHFATQALGEGRVHAYTYAAGYISEIAYFNYRVTTPSGGSTMDLQDLWWAGPQESGWAVSVAQDGRILFPVLYAYDAAGEPTWYVGLSDFQQSPFFTTAYFRYFFDVYSPRSAPYHAYDASRFQLGPPVMGLHFSFETASHLQLTVQAPGRDNVVKQLTRQDFTSDFPAPITGLGGMWWGGATQNGWAISLMEQAGGLFAVWATYGDDGKPTWFVMDSGTWTTDRRWEGRIVRPSGPRWPDSGTAPLRLEDVGTFRFDFHDPARATFTWSIGARSGVQPIERMPL